MSPLAITMLVISITLVWGGLALSIVHLLRHPDDTSGELPAEDIADPEIAAGRRGE